MSLTEQKVIELGKEALDTGTNISFFIGFSLLGIAMIYGAYVLFVHEDFSGVSFFLVMISIFLIVGGGFHESNQEAKKLASWKNKVVTPYIESLPIEKREVVYVKIDPEMSEKHRGYHYTTTETIERTPLTISFKENGLTTVTNWYETHMELTDEIKPYVTYQKVDKRLGKGVDKGFYNVKIYLPKNYEFTDIK